MIENNFCNKKKYLNHFWNEVRNIRNIKYKWLFQVWKETRYNVLVTKMVRGTNIRTGHNLQFKCVNRFLNT